MCMCVYLLEGMSQMRDKRTLGPLELELEALVSYSTQILGSKLGSSGSAPAISLAYTFYFKHLSRLGSTMLWYETGSGFEG